MDKEYPHSIYLEHALTGNENLSAEYVNWTEISVNGCVV